MKKNILRLALLAVTLVGITLPMWAWDPLENIITLSLDYTDPELDHPRTPVEIPQVGQSGHTLYFHDAADFTVNIYSVDEDENLTLEYTTFVPSTTEAVQLPTTLSGSYAIEVIRNEHHFWGEITL